MIESSYICRDCAIKNGAEPVIGHCFTAHSDKCPHCNKTKSLAHTSDWNWPNNKKLEKNREF